MKLVVTGASGQLGRATVSVGLERHQRVVGLTHTELPVEDATLVQARMEREQPDFVLHCGAFTDVDGCERDPELADRINGEGTRNVANACREVGAGLIYVSTDFVFAGDAEQPYREDDAPSPLSAYGRSKLLGEQAVLSVAAPASYVVRTSWVFGPGGSNFPAAILRRAREGQPLRVVDDQTGSPTYTFDLANAMLDIAQHRPPSGIYHASNEGICTWHRFAADLVEAAGLDVTVDTMSSAELDRPARRPAWSVLDNSKLAAVRGSHLPPYKDAIHRYLRAEEESRAQ